MINKIQKKFSIHKILDCVKLVSFVVPAKHVGARGDFWKGDFSKLVMTYDIHIYR